MEIGIIAIATSVANTLNGLQKKRKKYGIKNMNEYGNKIKIIYNNVSDVNNINFKFRFP